MPMDLTDGATAGCTVSSRRPARLTGGLATALLLLSSSAVCATPPATPPDPVSPPARASATGKTDAKTAAKQEITLDTFLDRLMIAESGGRLDARNPRSTAVGPYQFIVSTFIDVARRNFPKETENLSVPQLLAKRTDMTFARKVAAAYTQENADRLAAAGLKSSFPNLRLAFFLGPGGAIRVLRSPPETPMARLVSPAALAANPFLYRLTAAGLVARSAREVLLDPKTAAGIPGDPKAAGAKRTGPRIPVKCNLARPSCRKWLALQTAKLRKNGGKRVRVARGRR